MKNRFVIVDNKNHHEKPVPRAHKDSDEVLLKQTEALTFEGAYGELTCSGGGDWAPVKAEIQQKRGKKNLA